MAHRTPTSDFVLDQHLTVAAVPLPTGQLRAASDINQAIGVLIGDGYSLRQADWEPTPKPLEDQRPTICW